MVQRTGEASLHVEAPPEVLYALVADVTRMGEWSPETVRAEWVEGATAPVVGARFRGHNKRRAGWKTTCTVTVAEPGRQFAFEVGKGETAWRYSFAPSGSTNHSRLTSITYPNTGPGWRCGALDWPGSIVSSTVVAFASFPSIFSTMSPSDTTRRFTSAGISITSGQGRVNPSPGHFRVASTPIFEP